LGAVRARAVASWTVIAVQARGATLVTATLVTIGASCGTAVIA
jgi:hypothetical protein